MSWTVVSELAKGKTKNSISKKVAKILKNKPIIAMTLLIITGEVSAYDINSNETITSSAITDGLSWNNAAAVEIGQGATVTVSGGNPTINMDHAGSALWLNGSTLAASGSGTMLLGPSSFVQIGGKGLGGLTSNQAGGGAGSLTVEAIKTDINADSFTLWMFGSANTTAKLYASDINLTAAENTIWLANPSNSELGADVNVSGNMTVVNTSGGQFMMTGNSRLQVGGDLYLDTTNGSFLATNNSSSDGISVGGDLTFINNADLSNINGVSTDAGIYSTIVNVLGDINVIGKNIGTTGLQIINASGSGITTNGDFNIKSSVSGNENDVIFGHLALVSVSGNINLDSVNGAATNLYIGDSLVGPFGGAPTNISAKSIEMTGAGSNRVIFNNNTEHAGYLFDVAINGNGTVENQSGHTILDAASNYTGGTVISDGLLSIANNQALGSGVVEINTGNNDETKGLDIAYTDGSSFANQLSGDGYTTVSGNARITGANQTYAGSWNITGTAMSDKIVTSTHPNFGTGDIKIASNGVLIAETKGVFDFENQLIGDGTLIADNSNANFNFTSAAGDQFAGDVLLKNNHFALENTNTTALTNATLHIGSGNITTVGTGKQNIGGLAFGGGTLVFGDISPGVSISDRYIETSKELDLTGNGKIQITDNGVFENLSQTPNTVAPLLQQDSAGVMVKLADAGGTVTGDGSNLTLIDQDGKVISNKVITTVVRNGYVAAEATYDYRLTSGDNGDGLYVNYGLVELELMNKGDNALTLNAEGNTGSAADLSAKITGTGDLRIDTDTDVSLSNSANSYTGNTDVVAGTLKAGNDNVLGDTHLLTVRSGSKFDMNGYAQSLRNIVTEAGSILDFNQGSLTITDGWGGQTIAGDLTGAGHLILTQGAQLIISGSGAGMTADTTNDHGNITLLSADGLGSGNVDNSGSITLGENGVNATVTDYQIGSLNNSGTVTIGYRDAAFKPVAGTTLTVNGNYTGNGGHLLLNTVLGNDSSVTDKLVITGDTSGNTDVSVTNAGGNGDYTLNNIEIISVGGKSDGIFTQRGRIVAGAYDYSLVRGTGTNNSNWYLTNIMPPVDPVDPPVDPVDPPVDPVDPPVDPVDPPGPSNNDAPVYRPEGGSYIANIAAANTLFNTRLHDRLGETQYVDALTGEKKVTSLWLRQVGSHNNWRDGSGQLKTQSNSYVAQLGGDVAQWSTDGLNRGHLGLMAGYGNNHSSTRSSVTGYGSKGSINGYSVGAYGTWFANDMDKAGLYVDSWLQYSWFDNQVNGQQLASESYKSKGFTASLETGYTQKLGEFAGSKGTLNEWFIQPQAQVTWMGVKADDHREANGTRVSSGGDGNVQTRLGLRAYLKSHHAMDDSKGRTFEPFIESNWLHNTRSYNVNMDNVRINQAGARNIGEVKVGVEGQINPRVNLWGNIGTQMGDKGYNDSSAMIGVKFNF